MWAQVIEVGQDACTSTLNVIGKWVYISFKSMILDTILLSATTNVKWIHSITKSSFLEWNKVTSIDVRWIGEHHVLVNPRDNQIPRIKLMYHPKIFCGTRIVLPPKRFLFVIMLHSQRKRLPRQWNSDASASIYLDDGFFSATDAFWVSAVVVVAAVVSASSFSRLILKPEKTPVPWKVSVVPNP